MNFYALAILLAPNWSFMNTYMHEKGLAFKVDVENFYEVDFEVWDINDDELLSEEEWTKGHEYLYSDFVNKNFKEIDLDNDGYLAFKEYRSSLSETNYYYKWDINKNHAVGESELASVVFDVVDTNRDGIISEEEYNDFELHFFTI
jgi:hypothetical protein